MSFKVKSHQMGPINTCASHWNADQKWLLAYFIQKIFLVWQVWRSRNLLIKVLRCMWGGATRETWQKNVRPLPFQHGRRSNPLSLSLFFFWDSAAIERAPSALCDATVRGKKRAQTNKFPQSPAPSPKVPLEKCIYITADRANELPRTTLCH